MSNDDDDDAKQALAVCVFEWENFILQNKNFLCIYTNEKNDDD